MECNGCGIDYAPTHGNQRYHDAECKAEHDRSAKRIVGYPRTCEGCDQPFIAYDARQRYHSVACHEQARQRTPTRIAHGRNMNHRRRDAKRVTDLTAVDVATLLAKAKRCPLCRVRLTGHHPEPNAPQLDHVVPLNAGGTHTYANVRVICGRCNRARPNDGSDFVGQLGLGALH